MPYKKYYIYKEQVSVDMGETWDDTGNRAPSGDSIGEYSTLAECEGKTPCYDGKCKVTYSDGHVYEVECNNSTLASGETREWIRSDCPVNAVIGCCVTSIGEDAFKGRNELSSVTIPDSVTVIGNGAFTSCSSLTSITIPDSVRTLGTWSFAGCNFASITIPNSVVNIGGGSFASCGHLTSVVLPNDVRTIKVQTFEYCTSLTGITIPSSVLTIEATAFNGCTGMTSVIFGNNVYYIGEAAFYGCSGIREITIPSSLRQLGWSTFQYCSGLTSITCLATTPPNIFHPQGVTPDPFYDTNNCPIYVPAESVNAYKSASGWSTYASRIQAIT